MGQKPYSVLVVLIMSLVLSAGSFVSAQEEFQAGEGPTPIAIRVNREGTPMVMWHLAESNGNNSDFVMTWPMPEEDGFPMETYLPMHQVVVGWNSSIEGGLLATTLEDNLFIQQYESDYSNFWEYDLEDKQDITLAPNSPSMAWLSAGRIQVVDINTAGIVYESPENMVFTNIIGWVDEEMIVALRSTADSETYVTIAPFYASDEYLPEYTDDGVLEEYGSFEELWWGRYIGYEDAGYRQIGPFSAWQFSPNYRAIAGFAQEDTSRFYLNPDWLHEYDTLIEEHYPEISLDGMSLTDNFAMSDEFLFFIDSNTQSIFRLSIVEENPVAEDITDNLLPIDYRPDA